LLRNLVTSLILEERIETTVPKAKAMRPRVEKMITLGKRGDLAARRQAHAYLMTSAAVDKLFETIGPRFGDREGGFLRIVRLGWRKGDGADKVFVELLGSEKLQEKSARSESKPAPSAPPRLKKSMEESEAETQASGASGPAEDGEKKRIAWGGRRALPGRRAAPLTPHPGPLARSLRPLFVLRITSVTPHPLPSAVNTANTAMEILAHTSRHRGRRRSVAGSDFFRLSDLAEQSGSGGFPGPRNAIRFSGVPLSIALNPLRDRASERVAAQFMRAMRDGRCREQLAVWEKDYRKELRELPL